MTQDVADHAAVKERDKLCAATGKTPEQRWSLRWLSPSLHRLAVIGAVLLWASIVWGQQNTTVQLPTFNLTTVSTTVTVPDGGTALLGGIGRARESSVTRGVPMLSKIPGVNRLFTNRGIGRDVGLMNMSVTPRIIILEEEELRQTGFSYDALSQTSGLGAGGQSFGYGGAVAGSSGVVSAADLQVTRKAEFLTRNIARTEQELSPPVGVDPRLPSLAEIRRQNEQQAAHRAAEAEQYLAQGRRAQSDGKAGVAKIYYQMALRRADPTLAEEIMACLSALDSQPQPAQFVDR